MKGENVFGVSVITVIERFVGGRGPVNMVYCMLVKRLIEGGSVLIIVPAIDLDIVFPGPPISSYPAAELHVGKVVVVVGEGGVITTLGIHGSDAYVIKLACGVNESGQ